MGLCVSHHTFECRRPLPGRTSEHHPRPFRRSPQTGNPDARETLEDICGQYWFGDPAWCAQTNAIQTPVTRLTLLAKYARGALRTRPGYEEPS